MQRLFADSHAITSRDTNYRPILSVHDADGWIEVASFDAYTSWECETVVGQVRRIEYAQLGPAGSKHLFRVNGNATVRYAVNHVPGTNEHVNPATGEYSVSAGARDSKVQAVYTEVPPATEQQVSIGYTTDGGESTIAATGSTSYWFPPGYCRFARWYDYGDQPANLYLLNGQINAAAGKAGDYFHLRSGAGREAERLHPWWAIEIENVGPAAMTGVLSFDTHPGGA